MLFLCCETCSHLVVSCGLVCFAKYAWLSCSEWIWASSNHCVHRRSTCQSSMQASAAHWIQELIVRGPQSVTHGPYWVHHKASACLRRHISAFSRTVDLGNQLDILLCTLRQHQRGTVPGLRLVLDKLTQAANEFDALRELFTCLTTLYDVLRNADMRLPHRWCMRGP